MNPIKIEKGAIEALKRTIRLHDRMNELLKEDDKGPSWDGDVYLYTDSDLESEHIQYRIPTQVKGKNDEKLLKRNSISYPVAYKNLRNYRNDGGICYFVIVISDDGEKTAIFYNAMTPIKLASYLKGTEKKNAEQTKNITLMRLKNNDSNELYKILMQFGHDSKEQGTGELVRKAISINDIQKIDSIRMTTFASDNEETIKNMKSGEACLFGHLIDSDIWIPFEYTTQRDMEFVAWSKRNESFGIDGIPYYNSFKIMNSNKKYIIRLSENLCIDMSDNKINFELKTELEQVIKDIRFLEMLQQGTSLYIGKEKICDYENANLGKQLRQTIKDFTQIQLAVMKFELNLKKRLDRFAEADWKAINELVNLYQGKIRPKNETAWHMWWWQGKVVPFFIAINPDGEVCVENGTHFRQFRITIGNEKNEYQVSPILMFKRDVWEKLYEVDEKILLEEIEKSEFNIETEGSFSLLLVEVLAAYDTTKNEKYYDMAEMISEKLLEVSPENDYWKINKMQILKRKRDLSEDELQELEYMEEQTNDSKVLCAVNILMDNKRKAKKELDRMLEEDRKAFLTFPIYNLL